MIFYINHFSLIIFYHSVWLGFKLFGLRVQAYRQLVQFTLVCKGYNDHHCHNKPHTGNRAGVLMTSCPEEMVQRILRILKNSELKVDFGPCRQLVEFLPWRQIDEFSAIGA